VPFENAGAKFGLTFPNFRRPLRDMSQVAETIHQASRASVRGPAARKGLEERIALLQSVC